MANGTFSKMNTGIMDPNIMRLYNPQQFASNFGFMIPQIPQEALPPVPFIPEETPGGNRPDQFDPGTFNPNLLGQYVGSFNPNFPAAPSQLTTDLKDPFSTAYMGLDTIGQQEDEDQFGLANLLSLSPTFSFMTKAVPEILGKVLGGITDAFNTEDTDPNQPDGKGPKTTPDPAMDVKETYATTVQPSGKGPTTTGGASKSKQQENQALGKSRGFNYGGR